MFSNYSEVLVVTYISIVGAMVARPAPMTELRRTYLFALGFPLGYTFIVASAIFSLIIFSKFETSFVLGAPLLVALASRFVGGGGRIRNSAKDIAAVGAAYFALSLLFRFLNTVIFTFDSYNFIILGSALADGLSFHEFGARFAGFSIYTSVLHALTQFFGQDYCSSAVPLFMCCSVAGIAFFVRHRLNFLERPRSRAFWLLTLLTVAFISSSYFIEQQTFYVNGHTATGCLVLLATLEIVAIKNCSQESASGHTVFALFALLFSVMFSRIEGLVPLTLLLVIAAETRKIRWWNLILGVVMLIAFRLAWSWKLFASLGTKDFVASPAREISMLIPPLLVAVIYSVPLFRRTLSLWRPLSLLAILVGLTLCALLREGYYAVTVASFISNSLTAVPWGIVWPTAILFIVYGWRTKRLDGEEFVRYIIVTYVGMILCMSYFRPFRVGWQDSGNRMMIHLVPLVGYLILSTLVEDFCRTSSSSCVPSSRKSSGDVALADKDTN